MKSSFYDGFIRPISDKKGGSNIKSNQSGVATMTTVSIDIPINTVDLSESIVIVNFTESLNNTLSCLSIKGEITAANNLNLSRKNADAGLTVYWQVIEFNNVKSLQKGTYVLPFNTGSLDNLVSVNKYNISKSIVVISYTVDSTTGVAWGMGAYVSKYSENQLNIARNHIIAGLTVHWQLVEFS